MALEPMGEVGGKDLVEESMVAVVGTEMTNRVIVGSLGGGVDVENANFAISYESVCWSCFRIKGEGEIAWSAETVSPLSDRYIYFHPFLIFFTSNTLRFPVSLAYLFLLSSLVHPWYSGELLVH